LLAEYNLTCMAFPVDHRLVASISQLGQLDLALANRLGSFAGDPEAGLLSSD